MLLFDVGNTRVKSALADRLPIENVRSLPNAESPQWTAWIDAATSPNTMQRAAISSVNPPLSDALERQLRSCGLDVVHLRSDGSFFRLGLLDSDLETPQTTGIDRLLSALAAHQRSPRSHVMVVDCGSAITVNLTTADAVFRGGAIFPGLRLMVESLYERTASLPMAPIQSAVLAPAKNTPDAIRAGVLSAAVGGIRFACDTMCRRFAPDSCRIFLTGGDAGILLPLLERPAELEPNLVLEGLLHAATRLFGPR